MHSSAPAGSISDRAGTHGMDERLEGNTSVREFEGGGSGGLCCLKGALKPQ